MLKKIDTLCLETYPYKPHLETAVEILLKERSHSAFSYLGKTLPWYEYPHKLKDKSWIYNFNGRVKCAEKILSRNQVRVISSIKLHNKNIKEIHKWARNFEGDLDLLKRYSWHGQNVGVGVASSLISKYRYPSLDVRSYHDEIGACLAASAMVYERAHALLKEVKPNRVLTFNGRLACSLPIALAAESLAIPVLYHERGCNFRKYEIFTGKVHSNERLRSDIERYWAGADSYNRALALATEFYEKRRAGAGIGWVSYTGNQLEGEAPPKQLGLRRLVYFSSSDDEITALEDGAKQSFEPKGQKVAIERLISVVNQIADIHLVIRMHPSSHRCHKNEISWWQALRARNVTIIPPESSVDTYALMDTADIVCSYGSTMGIEASYWGRPSILLGDCGYYGAGCCYEPKSDNELRELLSCNLKPLPRGRSIKFGYYSMTFGREHTIYKPESLLSGSLLGSSMPVQRPVISKMASLLRKK